MTNTRLITLGFTEVLNLLEFSAPSLGNMDNEFNPFLETVGLFEAKVTQSLTKALDISPFV